MLCGSPFTGSNSVTETLRCPLGSPVLTRGLWKQRLLRLLLLRWLQLRWLLLRWLLLRGPLPLLLLLRWLLPLLLLLIGV